MLQVKLSSQDATADEIPEIIFETHKNGEIGTVGYLKFNQNYFQSYQSVHLNTSFIKTLVARTSLSIYNLLTWVTQNTRETQIPEGKPNPTVDFDVTNCMYFCID